MFDPMPTPQFLSDAQAASYLNLSQCTLEKLRVVGGAPVYRKLGRRVIYAISDLNDWADARACASTTEAATNCAGKAWSSPWQTGTDFKIAREETEIRHPEPQKTDVFLKDCGADAPRDAPKDVR